MRSVSALAATAGLLAYASAAAQTFNPAISVVLSGQYAAYENDPEEYAIPGFQLGGHGGLAPEGLGLDHTELTLSSNIDRHFYGQLSVALHAHEGETEVELEEAYVQTLTLPAGLGIKFGRFLSDIGYLNALHPHAWDFADAPLAYRAFLGNQYWDDGVQLTWVAPTDLYLELGAEVFRGGQFPASRDGGARPGSYSLFAHVGGDVGTSHSWRAGLSALWADPEGREGGHGHDHGGGEVEHFHFDGDSRLLIADFVWKWAPDGNARNRSLVLQAEFFHRREDGEVANEDLTELSSYRGTQYGGYVQAVYQFMPRWRVGVRHDRLRADNRGGDEEILEEAGLHDEGHSPRRTSLMLDFSPSEFSRLRLQYNRDDSGLETDNQLLLQYVMTLGAHGAHRF